MLFSPKTVIFWLDGSFWHFDKTLFIYLWNRHLSNFYEDCPSTFGIYPTPLPPRKLAYEVNELVSPNAITKRIWLWFSVKVYLETSMPWTFSSLDHDSGLSSWKAIFAQVLNNLVKWECSQISSYMRHFIVQTSLPQGELSQKIERWRPPHGSSHLFHKNWVGSNIC